MMVNTVENLRTLSLVLLLIIAISSSLLQVSNASIKSISLHLILDPVENTGLLIANITLSTDFCEYHEIPLDIVQLEGFIEFQYFETTGNISVLGLDYTNNTLVFVACRSGSITVFFTFENNYSDQFMYELVVNTEICRDYIPLSEVIVNLVGEYEILITKSGDVYVEVYQSNVVKVTGYGLVLVTFYPLISEITETYQTSTDTSTLTGSPTSNTATETYRDIEEGKQINSYLNAIIVVIISTILLIIVLVIIKTKK